MQLYQKIANNYSLHTNPFYFDEKKSQISVMIPYFKYGLIGRTLLGIEIVHEIFNSLRYDEESSERKLYKVLIFMVSIKTGFVSPMNSDCVFKNCLSNKDIHCVNYQVTKK